ncbi:hypothetical protein JO861_12455 [Rhodococcus hoagii]|uniref:hypothetical protein n=1 Tax=Rhodococcus hoagii TaxID=43767 RepID=UPI0011A08FFC|nr:hypothetical protein [Prescottella equi]MBM9837366.1 hypothetical protein [Prescottella equi]
MTTPTSDAPVVRPTRLSPFLPPAPRDDDGLVVSREATLRSLPKGEQLTRNRKIAGDLPDWEPLPPGEVLVVSRRVDQQLDQ